MNKNGALSWALQGYRQHSSAGTGMSSTESRGCSSSAPQWSSSRSASTYCEIFPAPADRSDWKNLKLGWLLADTLDGPRLVFRERDLTRARLLEQLLDRERDAFYAARRGIARAVPDSRKAYAHAIGKLKRLHAGLVDVAVGYFLPYTCGPLGRPALLAFPDYYAELSRSDA